jgi:asparagine synthetase B (glutamine-hydrolysing)
MNLARAIPDAREYVAPAAEWVLTIPLEPCERPPVQIPGWVERGPFRGFFEGILFDRDKLAESIGSNAKVSDAELVVSAYAKHGDAGLSRLRGKTIVARDPMGSHPLFYSETGSTILFAMSPRSLLACPGVARAFNRAALADQLCGRWPDRHETLYAAIRRLPPSWRAVVSGRRLRFERYWDPVPMDQPIEWLTETEVAGFEGVFNQAIDRCLSSGPTGIFLSGGLDSISVAAGMTDRARQNGHSLPLALSLEFPDPTCDEGARQAAVARHLGLRQYLIGFEEALGSRPLLEQTLGQNQTTAAPAQNPWLPAYVELARRAKLDGTTTICTGSGGDEWLCAGPYHSADLIRRGAFGELISFFWTLRQSYQLPLLAQARHTFWTSGLRPLAAAALHRVTPKMHTSSRISRLLAGDPVWLSRDPELRSEQRRRAESALTPSNPARGFYMRDFWDAIDHSLTSCESEEQYWLGKRMGVRFLHPFRDPDLVKMLSLTPPRLLNQGGRAKGLVRGKVAQRFPSLGLKQQRKVSAKSFFDSLLLREGPALANAAGDFPVLSSLGIVDGPAVRTFVLGELKQPGQQFQRIWHVMKLELWMQSQGASA